MKFALLAFGLCLPLAVLSAAERTLKVDRTRSFVDVDVQTTAKNFTAHLDTFDAKFTVDDAGKIKSAYLVFKFTDLKTGNAERDAEMIKWLGGGVPEGRFDLGILALAPDGQGQVSGKLTFHGLTQRVEFAVNVALVDGVYTVVGKTMFDFTDWGLKPIKRAYVLKVDPELTVRFKFTAAPAELIELPSK